jgi:carboxypeptidase D
MLGKKTFSESAQATQLTQVYSHIEVNQEHNGNLFFWHFQNRHIANRQRTVIWLNGGPGCSSMDGALMEIGPYRVKPDGNLKYNDGSWDEFANVLFIDNPVGTGYSYVDTDSYVRELKDMAEQIVTFLKTFFSLFPEYEDNDVGRSRRGTLFRRLM